MTQSNCKGCGAPLSPLAVACEFCGEKVSGADTGESGTGSGGTSLLQDLEEIEDEIHALESQPKPSVGANLYKAFYWYAVLSTLGFAAIFLSKPKGGATGSDQRAAIRKIERDIDNARDLGKTDTLVLNRLARAEQDLRETITHRKKGKKVRLGFAIGIPVGFVLLAYLSSLSMSSTLEKSLEMQKNARAQLEGADAVLPIPGAKPAIVTISAPPLKSNGKHWDIPKELPDLALCVEFAGQTRCYGDRTTGDVESLRNGKCKDTLTCVFTQVYLPQSGNYVVQVVDVDYGDDDTVGSGSCVASERSCEAGEALLSLDGEGRAQNAKGMKSKPPYGEKSTGKSAVPKVVTPVLAKAPSPVPVPALESKSAPVVVEKPAGDGGVRFPANMVGMWRGKAKGHQVRITPNDLESKGTECPIRVKLKSIECVGNLCTWKGKKALRSGTLEIDAKGFLKTRAKMGLRPCAEPGLTGKLKRRKRVKK